MTPVAANPLLMLGLTLVKSMLIKVAGAGVVVVVVVAVVVPVLVVVVVTCTLMVVVSSATKSPVYVLWPPSPSVTST